MPIGRFSCWFPFGGTSVEWGHCYQVLCMHFKWKRKGNSLFYIYLHYVTCFHQETQLETQVKVQLKLNSSSLPSSFPWSYKGLIKRLLLDCWLCPLWKYCTSLGGSHMLCWPLQTEPSWLDLKRESQNHQVGHNQATLLTPGSLPTFFCWLYHYRQGTGDRMVGGGGGFWGGLVVYVLLVLEM